MTTTYTPQLAGRFVVPPGYTASLEAVSCDWEADVSGYHLTATGSGRGGVYSKLLFEGTVAAGVGLVEIVADPSPDTVVIRDILGVPALEGTLKLYIQPMAGGSGNPCAVIDGGGATVEGVTVRRFPFAFDTPGLLTGATVYTTTPGDILLNAWLEVDTPWNGTSPLGDFGQFVSSQGWLGSNVAPKDMTHADTTASWGTGVLSEPSAAAPAPGDMLTCFLDSFGVGGGPYYRGVPAKFTVAQAIKVVVSQDGTDTGADPGSTQGSGVLYLVTATPV